MRDALSTGTSWHGGKAAYRWKMPREKISRSIVIKARGRSGPNLKRERGAPQYKLYNVCAADHRPANGAQITG